LSGRGGLRLSMAALPLRALYTVGELTKATAIPRRLLIRLFEDADVRFLRVGRLMYVPLSELEEKVQPIWEGIKAAEMLRHVSDDS
jgi:hypothetical protein